MRVSYDDIEYTDEQVYIFGGKPFTGIGVEQDEAGNVICEVPFLAGKVHGMARDYYISGELKSETPYVNGYQHGVEQKWYENGILCQKSILEFGVLMSSITWSKDGNVLEHFERAPNDKMARLVEERRRTDGGA